MEIHALIHREVHFVLTVGQHQAAMGINILNKARNGVDVDGVRQVAGESHDNRDIGMVAFTGQERSRRRRRRLCSPRPAGRARSGRQ